MASNDGQVAANGASDFISSDGIEQTGISVEQEQEIETPESTNEFSTKTWKEDLVLLVEGRQLYVNSGVLALASPIFSSMFEEAFKTEGPRALELSGRYDDFVEFLRCFYPGIMKPMTMENAPLVAPLAHQYQVESVKKLCEHVFIDTVMTEISPESFCSVIQLASSCQMVHLRRTCVEALTSLDDIQLEAAVSNLEITSDFKLELQDIKLAQLKENLAEKSKRCVVVENIITRTWSESLKINNLETVELGYIDVSIPNNCRIIEKSTSIKTITWTVQANLNQEEMFTKNTIVHYEHLFVNISAKGKPSMGQWTCKTRASCSISYGKKRLWKQTSDDTMRSRQLSFDFGKLNDFNISNTQDLNIDVCILVGDVLI